MQRELLVFCSFRFDSRPRNCDNEYCGYGLAVGLKSSRQARRLFDRRRIMTLAKLILIFAFVSAIPIGVTGSADTVVRDLESGDLWANPRLRFLFGFG